MFTDQGFLDEMQYSITHNPEVDDRVLAGRLRSFIVLRIAQRSLASAMAGIRGPSHEQVLAEVDVETAAMADATDRQAVKPGKATRNGKPAGHDVLMAKVVQVLKHAEDGSAARKLLMTKIPSFKSPAQFRLVMQKLIKDKLVKAKGQKANRVYVLR